eukprot:gene17552-19302_t
MAESFKKLDIKTVDFGAISSPDNFDKAADVIRKECSTSGFFLIKVPAHTEQQMRNVLKAAKMFFRLPLAIKERLKNDEFSQFRINGKCIPGTGPGYRGFSQDPNFTLDSRESFNIGPDNITKCLVTSDRYSGSGVTPWPGEEFIPGWKSTMKDYCAAMLDIGLTLRQLFAVALGLDRSFFDQPEYFDKGTWILGTVHYSAVKSDENKGLFGIRPHADFGMFTLLLGDGSPGLQVCLDKTVSYSDRVWVNIEPPPPGHLIVNLGQMLERWTNGKFKATLHRVMLDGENDRYSVPFFYEPNIDCVIKPVFGSPSPNGDCKYATKTCGKMLLERLEKSIEDFE